MTYMLTSHICTILSHYSTALNLLPHTSIPLCALCVLKRSAVPNGCGVPKMLCACFMIRVRIEPGMQLCECGVVFDVLHPEMRNAAGWLICTAFRFVLYSLHTSPHTKDGQTVRCLSRLNAAVEESSIN